MKAKKANRLEQWTVIRDKGLIFFGTEIIGLYTNQPDSFQEGYKCYKG